MQNEALAKGQVHSLFYCMFPANCVALTFLAYNLWCMKFTNRRNSIIAAIAVIAGYLDAITLLCLDTKAFGKISTHLYLIAGGFYGFTYLAYLYFIRIETVTFRNLSRIEWTVVYTTLTLSLVSLLPVIGYCLYALLNDHDLPIAYYTGLGASLLDSVFDLTVLYLVWKKLYVPKAWKYPLRCKLNTFLTLSVKLLHLLLIATPLLPAIFEIEIFAMHNNFVTVTMLFLDIQRQVRRENEILRGAAPDDTLNAKLEGPGTSAAILKTDQYTKSEVRTIASCDSEKKTLS